MAFAGAEQVYYNDITDTEVSTFKSLKKTLPEEIKDKLKVIDGCCFDILEKHPAMRQTINLVICRNLIHFFNPEQTEKLLTLIRNTLLPGGKAIITANSKNVIINAFDEHHEENPTDTCFSTIQCIVYDYNR